MKLSTVKTRFAVVRAHCWTSAVASRATSTIEQRSTLYFLRLAAQITDGDVQRHRNVMAEAFVTL